MKTRFTLTSLTLASLMMMGNTAMAAPINSGTSDFFNVKLTLTGSCETFVVNHGQATPIASAADPIAGADIDFGEHKAQKNSAELTGNNSGNTTQGIQVNCSKNTVFKVHLEPQNHQSADGSGKLKGLLGTSNTDEIEYQLYKPEITGVGLNETIGGISAIKWGKEQNSLSLTGKGLDTPIMLPVFAKIPQDKLSDKTPDTYQDRVKVTLTY